MQLGISLDAYLKTTTPEEGIRRLARIGFDAVDLNLSDYCQADSPLASDAWRAWIGSIGAAADESGIALSQAHAPIYWFGLDPEGGALLDRLTERSLEACEKLGIPWAVFHPRTPPGGCREESFEDVRDENVEWLGAWADRAAEYGVGLAVENLFRFQQGRFDTYGIGPDEILDLVARIDRPNVRVCLDTGHAFLSGHDPAAYATTLGDRLRVLHVHDNLGTDDQHVAPFVGKIDWPAFMAALRDVGYDGVFSLEVHCQVQNMPETVIDQAVGLVHEVGRCLIGHPSQSSEA